MYACLAFFVIEFAYCFNRTCGYWQVIQIKIFLCKFSFATHTHFFIYIYFHLNNIYELVNDVFLLFFAEHVYYTIIRYVFNYFSEE